MTTILFYQQLQKINIAWQMVKVLPTVSAKRIHRHLSKYYNYEFKFY
ncbi:hypothetical protein COO91_01993 [Nostoc flagelliforme CCNUN1]|uniref:Uncharacterized protein n=1 Tax=Nostoc flagelliforme CCNUN1 TaxID=2038116 RepID=A0A2K8SKU9_9NOSO|nr:hypothetical protein COO91_01993 [Nostoc flagelliforme CCNUN1]